MESSVVAVSKAMESMKIDAVPKTKKNHRIQVSNSKKPLFFYLNLAKRYMKQYNDVELSALGMAIPTVVTIAEILKSNGLAIQKHISTSTVSSKNDTKRRFVQKAKIEILLGKTDNFKKLNVPAAKVKVPVSDTNKLTTKTDVSTPIKILLGKTENFEKLNVPVAKVYLPVSENAKLTTIANVAAPVTENSLKLMKTAAIEAVTDNLNESTNTVEEAPVGEKSQELIEAVTENSNKLTSTAVETLMIDNSQELTTINPVAEAATEKKE